MEKPFLKKAKQNSIDFLKNAIESNNFLRDDYRELADLSLVVLGEKPRENFTFKICGVCHHARWMMKIIYVFKIFLFRTQFPLKPKEEADLKELSMFFALVYVKAWFSCSIPADAPANDLELFKIIYKYKKVNAIIAQAAIDKLVNHLWYLSPELVWLSLFSGNVCLDDKIQIQKELQKYTPNWAIRKIRPTFPGGIHNKKLYNFIDASSLCSIQLLGFDLNWLLQTEPSTWQNSANYEGMLISYLTLPHILFYKKKCLLLGMRKVIQSLRVVNDVSERSVALMIKINNSYNTKDESETQKIIQVVDDNRKRLRNCHKSTLKTYKII
jgi:hypothetical protein